MKMQLINATIEEKRPFLKRLAYKFTQDPIEIEDLVQETLIRSLTSLERLIQEPKLISWLYVIMKNTYINQYRKMMRAKAYHLETATELAQAQGYNRAEANFILNDIEKAIDGLQENYYICFRMFIDGYKYREIAEYVGIPEGTVKTRIHHSRKLLQKRLRSYNR